MSEFVKGKIVHQPTQGRVIPVSKASVEIWSYKGLDHLPPPGHKDIKICVGNTNLAGLFELRWNQREEGEGYIGDRKVEDGNDSEQRANTRVIWLHVIQGRNEGWFQVERVIALQTFFVTWEPSPIPIRPPHRNINRPGG